ncbi:MAG: CHAP domain-containing protein [Ruminococcaceae bacterium]|nr:CHAP domain-containing protein [Oscillospiraceae bacterium]
MMKNAFKKSAALFLTLAIMLSFMTIFAAAATANVAEMKAVTLQNVKTGQYLNIDYGKMKNGTFVRVWPWDGSKEQLFDIDNIGGDTYRILANKSSKYCIDVYRGNSKLKAGQKIDIWETGTDTTAQNVKLYICDDGSVIIRMAANENLALSANGSKAQLKLAKFSATDKAQKWIVKDKNGNKIDVVKPIITASVVTANAYAKTNTSYTVNGNKYYLAKTTRAYNGVAKDTEFWIDANNNIVTDFSIKNKLDTLKAYNNDWFIKSSATGCRDIAKVAGDYYDIYTNILATEKLGSIIGKGSGMLLSIGAGNAVSMKEAAFDMLQEAVSVENIKTAAYLAMLQIYSNNAEVFGIRAANLASGGFTDYDRFLEFNYCYSEAFANFTAIKYLIGDDIVEMKNSNLLKEEWKYFKNVFWGFADTFLPDIKVKDAKTLEDAIEAAKVLYELDGDIEKCFTVLQFADVLGVTEEYEKALKNYKFKEMNSSKSETLEKLTKAEVDLVAKSWDQKVGKTVANIKNSSGYTKYYGRDNAWSYQYKGQCTWYAWGRFYETVGIKLNYKGHAKYFLDKNSENSKIKILKGADSIVSKSIAVDTSGEYGHVMFIEYVSYGSDGSPKNVYFTESNWDFNHVYNAGTDCILKKMSFGDFKKLRSPDGYIAAK